LLARGVEDLEAAAAEVRAAGGVALVLPTDVADAAAVESAAEAVERELGPIDIWVNCAMATIFSPVWEISPQEFRRATEVTYLGFVHGTMAALRRMRPRNRGTIVQVGSALAYRAIPLQSAYCGAKFAIRAFTDALRSELIHEGSNIHLMMAQLPAVNTPQFNWARNRFPRRPQPLPPIYEPEAIAEAVYRASSNPPRELWIGWPTLKLIAGAVVVPGFLDRYLAKKAYDGQFTGEPASPNESGNLFEPGAAGEHTTRGRFSDRAYGRVVAVNPNAVRIGVAASLFLLLAAALLGRRL
jgi:NAD(P)-dependent dehydrogenase (short-subunit alcohol dehydrogenase family)